ncbi:DUF2460 domain-containing protein [Hellea sp.]|nr:DUF2460 domain-containing protein [Hellea sp.]
MPDFHNVRFPVSLAFGASGGPSRRTDITALASGMEHRNSPHAHSRRRYNAGAGVKTLGKLHDLIAFFEARFGQLHSFRFRDPLDFKSCKPDDVPAPTDQIIGTGDGTATTFKLIKSYVDAAGAYERPITKPVSGTVKCALNGVEILASEFTVDELSGEVEFSVPPPQDSVISCGFEFDVPVRFDIDQLDVSLEAFGAGQVINIPLIEVLDHA